MTNACSKKQHPEVTLAVAECFTPQAEIPQRIPELLNLVYAWLKVAGLSQAGNNYILYDQFQQDGMRMRVGFPVSAAFADEKQVSCLVLDERTTAHTRHSGAYSGLPQTHQKLNEWCAQENLKRAALAWEVYGDWSDDDSKLVTDVYIALDIE